MKKKTIKAIFDKSKYFSLKWSNYFNIYENLFSKYKNKKIKFVEIGVFSGGSLFLWKNYFYKGSKIIGVEYNPDAARFRKYGFNIEIGDQSNPEFWKKFFKKYGKVDIILDDGGHTNYQQIITANCCIPNIKDGGLFITEDTHTSYMKEKFYNPSKYSFINFCKKKVDDVNSRFEGIIKIRNSLKKFIFSIRFFESIVCFDINRKFCKKNILLRNRGKTINPVDYRHVLNKKSYLFKLKKFFNLRKIKFTYLVFLINSFKVSKFFK